MPLELQSLVDSIAPDAPCGVDLDGTLLLAGFDSYGLWGRTAPLPEKVDWREIREKALETLERSRDLRVLAHLGAATVRLEGLFAFSQVLQVAEQWLASYWDQVFPLVDDDALLRKNALNSFADRMAVVDAVRRATFVAHRQLGAFSLRDVELANGQIAPTEKDVNPPNLAQIVAAIKAAEPEQVSASLSALRASSAALRAISDTMQQRADLQSTPDFDPLLQPLTRLEKFLAEHSGQSLPAQTANGAAGTVGNGMSAEHAGNNGAHSGNSFVRGGRITSRQEAISAIEAAAAFFREYEPSSPVPMFLDRAKRLVSKNFMEVLEDIVPDSLGQAKLIGGVVNEDGSR
jgi:type VI secretion system protein ImpA